jgi:hypothetical protein
MITTKTCGNCSVDKNIDEYRKLKEKRTKIQSEYLCSICKTCEKERALVNYRKNRDKNIENNKKYKQLNREKINKTRREYIKKLMKNPFEKIKRNMKSLISCKLRSYKSKHTADYLGTNIQSIMAWIEFNMDNEMNWDNYGSYWEIDHSIPISLFDMSNQTEVLDCFCWMNLMPMEKLQNCKKYNKLDISRIEYQKNRLKLYSEQFPNVEQIINEYIEKYDNKVKSLL